MQCLQNLDRGFAALFGQRDDEEGDESGAGGDNVSGFIDYYGWHYQCELVADYERIPLAAVYDLSALNFLNDLAYIKAKKEDERLTNLKQQRNGGY